MASIKKRNGTYQISVSAGYGVDGRQIRKYKTWVPDPGMTEKQASKEVQRQAVLFEEQVRNGDCLSGRIKLCDFIELWFRDYGEKQLRPSTLFRYKTLVPRVNASLGHLSMDKIRPNHLLQFYGNLSEEGIRRDVKFKARDDIKEYFKKEGITAQQIANGAGIGINTVTQILQCRNVSPKTVNKVCDFLGVKSETLFTPVYGKRGTQLSESTLRYYHAFLSSLFTRAVRWQIIKENPCQRIDPPHAKRQEARFLNEADAMKLLQLLENETTEHRAMIYTLMFCGCRRGELCGLTWADIDFENRVIDINKTSIYLPGSGVFDDDTKTESSRRKVTVPRAVIDLLKQHKQEQNRKRLALGDKWQNFNKVFTTWDGRPIHPSTITAWFNRFTSRHGLDVSVHSLRHTSATLLIASGADIKTVSKRLGHSLTATTLNVYIHALQSADEAASDALETMLLPKKKTAL